MIRSNCFEGGADVGIGLDAASIVQADNGAVSGPARTRRAMRSAVSFQSRPSTVHITPSRFRRRWASRKPEPADPERSAKQGGGGARWFRR